MTKALIVDDEPKNVKMLSAFIEDCCLSIQLLPSAGNVNDAFDAIKSFGPDLVFLDIEMPYGNGFDLLEKLSPLTFEVIFVTAFHQYAIQAFKYNSIDYLLKPIIEADLKKAVERAEERIRSKSFNAALHKFVFNNHSSNKIGLPTAEGYIFICANEIVRCKADGSYTEVHLQNKSKHIISKNLKELEAMLDSPFFCRVHHSHMVNINFVKKYYRGKGGYLELEDGTSIEVSARKKNYFLDMFKL